VRLRASQVTATVGGGPDTTGGNIRIDPEFVILEDSQIVANAFAGQGGTIQVTTDVLLADPVSRVDASSALGIDGTVDIRAPVTNVSGTVAPLPQTFGRQIELLRGLCAQRLRGGERSSFVLARRDGIPLEPGTLLPSPLRGVSPAGAGSGRGQQPLAVTQASWLRVDAHGALHVRGAPGSLPVPGALDGPCAPGGR
jgi:large exoprotein involved in heme utilization and adhesion